MNLKLLEKLVRLANNNPNENESNLAARRACRLIEDAKFNFTPDVVTIKPPQPYTPSKPSSSGIWNDVKRSTEPGFRSTVYDEYQFNPDLDYILEFFKRRTEEAKTRAPWTSPYPGPDFKVNFEGGQRAGKTQREKRPLNCHRCGKEYQTMFVGPPQMFTCNECHWAIYREEQEAKKNEPSRAN